SRLGSWFAGMSKTCEYAAPCERSRRPEPPGAWHARFVAHVALKIGCTFDAKVDCVPSGRKNERGMSGTGNGSPHCPLHGACGQPCANWHVSWYGSTATSDTMTQARKLGLPPFCGKTFPVTVLSARL